LGSNKCLPWEIIRKPNFHCMGIMPSYWWLNKVLRKITTWLNYIKYISLRTFFTHVPKFLYRPIYFSLVHVLLNIYQTKLVNYKHRYFSFKKGSRMQRVTQNSVGEGWC
jgi:hypothetical protein